MYQTQNQQTETHTVQLIIPQKKSQLMRYCFNTFKGVPRTFALHTFCNKRSELCSGELAIAKLAVNFV